MTTTERIRQARTGLVGRSHTLSLKGLDARPILVEAVTLSGLPNFNIVGLPDAAVGEAKERVRAGFSAIGVPWPNRRLTVNLSPGNVPKSGTGFDVSLAVAILASLGAGGLGEKTIVLGELGLNGAVRGVNGVIPACDAAARQGFARVVVPSGNAAQARLVPGIEVIPVSHLSQVAAMCGVEGLDVAPLIEPEVHLSGPDLPPDLGDVRGQNDAIYGLMVAAVGGHHAMMVGPPGVGKSMLAERLPGILPDLTTRQAVEVAAIQSLTGANFANLPTRPVLESPHHSATVAALVGGGSGIAKPGAITKAHHGVLFCDEFPEFSTTVIQSLRQPLESGVIELDRVYAKVVYPAKFQLVAAANPCRCGRLLDGPGKCTCTARERASYRGGLGGPVRDRIDINLTLRRPSRADLRVESALTSSAAREEVSEARERQLARAAKFDAQDMFRRSTTGSGLDFFSAAAVPEHGWGLNRDLAGSWLRTNTELPSAFRDHVDRLLAEATLTMRGVDRILRISWSIADLAGHDAPTTDDLYMSIALRQNGEGL